MSNTRHTKNGTANPDPIIGPHSAELRRLGQRCAKCAEDATKYFHCSWCGADLGSLVGLTDHLDLGCGDAQGKALVAARRELFR